MKPHPVFNAARRAEIASLTPSQANVYRMIAEAADRNAPAPSTYDLSLALGYDPMRANGLIRELVSLGLIAQEFRTQVDRRFRIVDSGAVTNWTSSARFGKRGVARACIVARCGKPFISEGPGHRMCDGCRSSISLSAFEVAALPSGRRVNTR